MPHRFKPKIIAHRLRQIASNRALSRKFEKWCNFQVELKRKRVKIHRVKRDLLAIVTPLFKELTEEENIQGNRHTLQELKETIEQTLPV